MKAEAFVNNARFSEAELIRFAFSGVDVTRETPNCLDAESIASVVEGHDDRAESAAARAHLVECARCRNEVASLARLLEVPEVRKELDHLRQPVRNLRIPFVAGALLTTAAAAALTIIVGRPSPASLNKPVYREESVTGFAAPRLLAPLGAIANINAFQWTSVPRADRYRITVYNRDGSVIWETLTRDTVITPPEVVQGMRDATLLWRVAAHVGWEDRWTASDLAMLSVSRTR